MLVGRTSALAALFLLAGLAAAQGGKPPTLTTAIAAHSLNQADAAAAWPVHLRAIVTYYDPLIDRRHGALFLKDASGGVFVAVTPGTAPPMRPGSVVDVQGVTAPGDYAPIVAHAVIRLLGQSHIPLSAPRVTMAKLLTGAEDGQWVEVEGVVRSVAYSEKNVTLSLALSDGTIRATTLRQSDLNYNDLVDTKVLIHEAPLLYSTNGVRWLAPGYSFRNLPRSGSRKTGSGRVCFAGTANRKLAAVFPEYRSASPRPCTGNRHSAVAWTFTLLRMKPADCAPPSKELPPCNPVKS